MKYFSRANIYKNSAGTNVFDPEAFEARSYDWWVYVKDFNGTKVFNTYRYSNTTSKHQSNMRGLLNDLGERLDTYWMIEAPKGLQDLDSAIEYYKYMIQDLKEAIAKPRSQAKKNDERRGLIKQYQTKIKMIKRLKAEERK